MKYGLLWLLCLIAAPAFGQEEGESGELRVVQPDGNVVGLALERIDVQVNITGTMAEVEIQQTFQNPFEVPVEALYVFPMSVDAAVNAYQIVIGERIITGEIHQIDEARRIYEEARDEGRTTGLLEQSRPNIFLQSIANLPPGAPVTVRVRYVEQLRYDRDTGFGFVFPMTITPRYATPGSTPAVPPGYSLDGSRGAAIALQVEVDAGLAIQSIDSPSHVIAKQIEGASAQITLAAGQEIPNQDFRLHLRTAAEDLLATVLAHRDDTWGGFYSLMVLPPVEARAEDITPREVALILDTSGSMIGEPLAQSKAVCQALLNTLTPRDTLNIFTFAGDTRVWSPAPRPATVENLSEARLWLNALGADGGTEIGPAVHRALDIAPAHAAIRLVYLFTDGAVDEDDASSMVQNAQEGNRLFPVGTGPAPNRWLLDRLAEEGRGFASYLNSEAEAEEVAERLVRRTAAPVLTDVRLEWQGLQVAAQTPLRIADLYTGQPLVVSGRYGAGGSGEVIVHGTRAGQPVSLRVPVTLPDAADRRPVAYTWARRRIHELMGQPSISDAVVSEITKLGLEFSLVTPYTAFVAADTAQVESGNAGDGLDSDGDGIPDSQDPYDDSDPFSGTFDGGGSSEGCQTSDRRSGSAWLLACVFGVCLIRRPRR